MGFLVRLVLAVVAGVLLGIASAWALLDRVADQQFVANGAWRIAPDAGSATAGLYTRAAIAKDALLALPRTEALYLNATHDDSGAALVSTCSYTVAGGALPAAWWSLTAYDSHGFLIANPQHRYSFPGSEVAAADGSFSVVVSRDAVPGAWLPLGDTKRFSLTLRLYQPTASAAGNPKSFLAPRIVKGACR